MGTLLSFVLFTALVGYITYLRTRQEDLGSRQGYFLGGNSLNGWVIAGSLLLTNLSAANFTGMTAMVYGTNLAPIAWTVTVIPPLVLFAGLILPTFLRQGYATIPEYLEHRYGTSTRRIVTALFLFGYIFGGMPVALYGGAIAIIHLFDVPAAFGISHAASVWVVVWALGITGGIYALFGGLRGVAVSDSLNGAALLVGGALLLWFGIRAVGGGEFLSGARVLLGSATWKLDAIGGSADLVPIGVVFTGMLLHNLYYWCANQFIVQRCFGARSLSEGQKGVLIAGFFKILNVLYIAVPGIIAYHLYGAGRFANNDWVYPTLVRDVMPAVLVGFFAAVVFGTVISTYNSVLNSSVTLFALDLYKPLQPHLSDAVVIRRSKLVGTGLALLSMVIAPLIMHFDAGIFHYMVKTEILFGAPIFLILFLGYFTRKASAPAANIVLGSYLITLALFQNVVDSGLHFLHVLALLFALHALLFFVLARLLPSTRTPAPAATIAGVDLRPWKHFRLVSALAVATMAATYVAFSPWGLVDEPREKEIAYVPIAAGLVLATGIFALPWISRRRGQTPTPAFGETLGGKRAPPDPARQNV